MNNGELARIKYYRGQMLTAQDFKDQQEYHREKQRHLLERFPYGIIGGLGVKCKSKDDADPSNSNGFFLIEKGLAVDRDRNEIIVPEEGVKVPLTPFDESKPYLSLVYSEDEESVGDGLCGGDQKNNRIKESFTISWDKAPNLGPNITVAKIELKDDKEAGSCDSFKDPIMTDETGGPRIRLDARVVDSDQIRNGAITTDKIANGGVNKDKLADNAVIESKIFDGAVTKNKIGPGAVSEDKLSTEISGKLVTGGNSHDHTGGHGAPIPEGGLDTTVKTRLVTNGDGHDHSGGDGKRIPEAGLDTAVTDKLVTGGDDHDHTGGHGALIPEEGLDTDVKGRLVTNGNSHDHSGNDGALIPETGLDANVRAKLVTNGNAHDHSGSDGALIPESGLDATVKGKLVTNGNNHDHSGSDGNLIPETGLDATVKAKLVTNGNSHDHSGNDGALIPETGLDANVQGKLVTNGNGHDHSGNDGALIPETGLVPGVVARLVTGGDTHNHTGGHGALIPKEGLEAGSVTTDKLALTIEEQTGTFGDDEDEITFDQITQNAIIQVIPDPAFPNLSSALSWSYVVTLRPDGFLDYRIKVKNETGDGNGNFETVHYKARAIKFGS